MSPDNLSPKPPAPAPAPLEMCVGNQEERKLRARAEGPNLLWLGLGMMGMVGWSVAVPTLLGIGLGVWIDRTWQTGYSATLMGLFVGLALGCLNAWFWIKQQ